MMIRTFWLDPRDKPGLLVAVMKILAGNAHISFEGDFIKCDFSDFKSAVYTETEYIKREYDSQGKGPIIVLPLEPDTIKPILKQVLPEGRIVHEIGAIQIEKNGKVEFVAADNFHRECVSVGSAVPEDFLKQLVQSGVLRGYKSQREVLEILKTWKSGNTFKSDSFWDHL
jgi:hypothetical protein